MALNEENQVIEDMSLSLSQGHINDVTFQLSDGRTEANRTILTIRSEYFRTMFHSHFREKHSDLIEMPYRKVVFDKVVWFLYTGNLEFRDLSLTDLLQLEYVLNLMLLQTASEGTSEYLKQSSQNGGLTLVETIKALDLTYEYGLETSKLSLLNFLRDNLSETSELPEFLELPSKILKDLLLVKTTGADSYDRLKALQTWRQEEGNDLDALQISLIRDSLDLKHFTTQDLVGIVRKSDLFPQDLIIEALTEVIKSKDESLAVMSAKVTNLELQYDHNMSTIEKLKDDLNELKFTFDTNFCNNKFGGEILTRERTSHSFWSQNGLGAQDILITLGRQRRVNRLQFRLKRRPELVMGYMIYHLPQLYRDTDDDVVQLTHCLVDNRDKDARGLQEVFFHRQNVDNIVIKMCVYPRTWRHLNYGGEGIELGRKEGYVFISNGAIDVSLCSFSENFHCDTL